MCCRCWRHYVDIIVADMKLLLVCLVLLGCMVSHVLTNEQTQLMKRILRGQENEHQENIENESKYMKCTQYGHDCFHSNF